MQADAPITFVKTEDGTELLTLGERLAWARKRRKLSQAKLGVLAKVSQGTIGNLESGIRKNPRALLSITKALRINPNWLETGNGEWEAKGGQPELPKGAVFEALSTEEKELIGHWRQLLGKDRRAKLAEIAAQAKERAAEKAELFEMAGMNAIAERAAHASRKHTDHTEVDVTDALKQKHLFDPAEEKSE